MAAIDVLAYTPKKRNYLKCAGIYCVYVIAPEVGHPVKIGMAFDIYERLAAITTSHWKKLVVHYLLWTPGKPVAKSLETRAHELLTHAGKRLSGEWFSITPDWAQKTIRTAADTLYPALEKIEHAEMIAFLRGQYIDKRDHVGKPSLDYFLKSEQKANADVESRIADEDTVPIPERIAAYGATRRKEAWRERERIARQDHVTSAAYAMFVASPRRDSGLACNVPNRRIARRRAANQ